MHDVYSLTFSSNKQEVTQLNKEKRQKSPIIPPLSMSFLFFFLFMYLSFLLKNVIFYTIFYNDFSSYCTLNTPQGTK